MFDYYPKLDTQAQALDEMGQHLDEQAMALERIRELLEQLLAMPFTVSENGLGEEERDLAEGAIWSELKAITGARDTCSICGEMYVIGQDHMCW